MRGIIYEVDKTSNSLHTNFL